MALDENPGADYYGEITMTRRKDKKKGCALRRTILWFAAMLVAGTAGFAGYVYLALPDVSGLRTINPASTSLIRFRQAQARAKGESLDIRLQWVPFDLIPALLKDAVRVTEDFSFYWHKGVDYDELRESIRRDVREGKLVRGGSTITQQLAKNLYLSTEKSLLRKAKEYLIARRLEKALPKGRIFEIYLNVIELGPGVFGVGAAARTYFDRDVADLDLERIVRLTAVIPRPLSADPRGSSAWLRWRCGWILGKLELHKMISDEEYRSTLAGFQ